MDIDLWVFVALLAPMSLLAWGFLAVQTAEFLASLAGRVRARHGTLRHALARGLARVLVRVAWGVAIAAAAVAWWRWVWPHEAARWLSASVPVSLLSVWTTRLAERGLRRDAALSRKEDDHGPQRA